ncbi:hypothetical protein ABZ372_32600, partial [Streptomyces sp. NPDC005921]
SGPPWRGSREGPGGAPTRGSSGSARVMVSDGRSEVLDGAVQQSMAAGLCIVVSVVAFNVLGERLAQRFGGTR